MRFEITARLNLHLDPDYLIDKYGLGRGGRVQRYIDQAVIDDTRPYVPASPDRTLEFSAQLSTEIGSGLVVYNTPYAHYQNEGIVYGPNIPIHDGEVLVGFFSPPGRRKYPTDRELTYDTAQNPLAGPHFFERSKADNCKKWVEGANRVAKQGE